MANTNTSPALATDTLKPYVQRAKTDPELREDLNAAGLKAYGLLIGDPRHPDFPYQAVDVTLFDPHRNRRNEPANRAAFHAQGSYFRAYEDAGFVAARAEENQMGSVRLARIIWPLGPACSSTFMPQ